MCQKHNRISLYSSVYLSPRHVPALNLLSAHGEDYIRRVSGNGKGLHFKPIVGQLARIFLPSRGFGIVGPMSKFLPLCSEQADGGMLYVSFVQHTGFFSLFRIHLSNFSHLLLSLLCCADSKREMKSIRNYSKAHWDAVNRNYAFVVKVLFELCIEEMHTPKN